MPELPGGVVTFLFSDIEGSTALWDRTPDAMRDALAAHDAIAASAIEGAGGVMFKHTGDGFAAVFASPSAALVAAATVDERLSELDGVVLRSRFGIHTGEAIARDGDYFGPDVNKAARIMDAGNGGQIVISAVSHALIGDGAPPGMVATDVGDHRLKDLGEPVRLFVAALTEEARERSLRTLDVAPNNLPVQLSSFIGREHHIEAVADLVREGRLTTLTGIGGVGKTRLSLQVAAEVLHEYADGVWLLELAGLTEPGLLPQSAISALRVRPDTARPPMDQLLDEIRAKEMLIVVDNCEHLIDDVAKFVEQVLRAAPLVRVLATSREGLAIGGERLWRVPSLEVDGDAGAIALFEERARLVRNDFEVTDDNRDAVAELCTRLDGIPLAIELATARLKMLDVHQIAQHLGDRFRLLTGGARTSVERQRTLLAMMDWSYDLLNEYEQALLRRLAVFVGGFTFDAAETVTAGDELPVFEILDLLSRLVETSLVTFEEQPQPRYRLLETVRQYASDKLVDAGEADEARRRHARYFGDLALGREEQSATGLGADYIEGIGIEIANMRAAMTWAYEAGEASMGLRVASGIRQYFYNIAANQESWEWLARGLREVGELSAPWEVRALAYGLTDAGNVGAWGDMPPLIERAEAILETIDDVASGAALKNALANTKIQSDVTTARRLYMEAIEMYRSVGSPRWVNCVVNLTLMLVVTADRDLAESLARLVVEAEADGIDLVVSPHATRALIALALDDPDEAIVQLTAASDVPTTAVDRMAIYNGFSDAYRAMGELEKSEEYLVRAKSLREWTAGAAFFGGRAESMLLLDQERWDEVLVALQPVMTNTTTTFGKGASTALVASIHTRLAFGRGDIERAVIIRGFWQKAVDDGGLGVFPKDRRTLDLQLAQAREALGDDTVDRLLAEGAGTAFVDLPLYTS